MADYPPRHRRSNRFLSPLYWTIVELEQLTHLPRVITASFQLCHIFSLSKFGFMEAKSVWVCHYMRYNYSNILIHAGTDTVHTVDPTGSCHSEEKVQQLMSRLNHFSYTLNWMSLVLWCWQQIVLHVGSATLLFWNRVRAHYSNWRRRQRPAATGPDVKGFYENP